MDHRSGDQLLTGDAHAFPVAAPDAIGVFGNTTGIAPGYRGSLSWWKLVLYNEGEYLFDTGDRSASFFYNWFNPDKDKPTVVVAAAVNY